MTRTVVDAEIEVYQPGTTNHDGDTPGNTVTNTDIESVQVHSRLQKLKDKGQIHIDNTDGAWADKISIGDEVRLRTQLDGENSLSHRWTGIVENRTIVRNGPNKSQLRLEVTDFVFGVLSLRLVFNAFEDTQIAGTSSSIVDTIVTNEAAEIDTSKIDSVTKNAWVYYNGKNLLEALIGLADKGNAVIGSDDEALIFKPLSSPAPQFTLASSDYALPVERRLKDINFANHVRVAGGTGTAVADDQNTQDGYTTVTDSSRITHQLSTSKSQLARVEVWTDPTGSGESVIVRIQSNSSGSPWDVSNREADIYRKEVKSTELVDDGLTTFIFDHAQAALPDPDPWLIIESSGSTGQDIGVNTSTSEPRFEAYYPYELASQGRDQQSINEYRRRETKIRNDNLQSTDAVDAVTSAKLNHDAQPESEISFEAKSNQAHNLTTGQVIFAPFPNLDASGKHIVIERTTDIQGSQLTTDLIIQDTSTV